MTVEHQKNYLKTVVRKLAKIDIFKIQRLKQAKPISEQMYSFCCSIFDFYSYDVSIVSEIYHQERTYFHTINEFDGIDVSKQDSLRAALDIIKEITEINSDTVYYLCQNISNEKYPMYALEDIGWKVIHNFCDLMEIPKFVIQDLSKSDSKESRSYVWRLIFNNPNYPWYIDNDADYCKEYNSKKSKLNFKTSYLEQFLPKESTVSKKRSDAANKNLEFMANFMKEANTFTSTKSSNYQQITYLIQDILSRYSVFDRDDLEFSGLTHSGFSSLLSSERKQRNTTIKAISKDISEIISNDKIKQLLEMFPELGINGSLFESKPFYKVHCPNTFKGEDGTITTEALFRGNPIIKYASITICPYATWNHEYNGLLGKLFHHLKIDIDLLSYSESGTPIIQL
jgi:hypothetical protein